MKGTIIMSNKKQVGDNNNNNNVDQTRFKDSKESGRGKGSFDKPKEHILQWVQQFEKFNANLECDQNKNGSRGQNNQDEGDKLPITTATRDIRDELCFESAQLITELLLILFAACLLIIAGLVIFSKKIPVFMESYDLIPKFLFFLCIIAGAYSLARWLFSKIYSRFHPTEQRNNNNYEAKSNTIIDMKTSPSITEPLIIHSNSKDEKCNKQNFSKKSIITQNDIKKEEPPTSSTKIMNVQRKKNNSVEFNLKPTSTRERNLIVASLDIERSNSSSAFIQRDISATSVVSNKLISSKDIVEQIKADDACARNDIILESK